MTQSGSRAGSRAGSRPIAIGLGAALLAGCSGQAIERFESTDAVGDPFTQRLAAEYRQTVAFEAGQMYDWGDAAYFARKGAQVAAGERLPPEAVEDWAIPAALVEEMSVAHGRLAKVLDDGARDIDPQAAAVAQAKFDCWIEQQEENHQPEHIAACRDDFLVALTTIEDKLAPQATVDLPVHLVFFDHDSAEIPEAARRGPARPDRRPPNPAESRRSPWSATPTGPAARPTIWACPCSGPRPSRRRWRRPASPARGSCWKRPARPLRPPSPRTAFASGRTGGAEILLR